MNLRTLLPRFTFRQYGFLVGLVFLLAYQFFLLHPTGTGFDRIIDDRDAYLHTWNLWWVNEAIFEEGTSPYHTDFNGYPEGISLVFNQLILPLGVASAPLFWLGFTAGQVLLFWQYVFGLIGYLGMYALVKYFNGGSLGATVGGLHFVLLPIYWRNLPTPDSLSYVLFPSIVLAVYWAQRGSWLRLVVPVLLGGLVLMMSPYFGAGLGLLWLLALLFCSELSLNWIRLALVAPLTLLLTAFHWGRQFLGDSPNVPSLRIVEAFSADLTAWFLPPAQLWWMPEDGSWWVDAWAVPEGSLYVGWFGLAFLVAGLFVRGVRRNRFPLLVVGVFFVVALGPAVTVLGKTVFWGLPYQWGVELLPFLRAFRAPVRFGFFVLLFCSLGIGVFFPKAGIIRWLLAVLILLELVRVPVRSTDLPDYQLLEKVGRTVNKPALVPIPLTAWPSEVQYAQTIHRKKLPLLGITFAPDGALEQIAANPVLDALYNRRDLPGEGWNQLRSKGFGGIIYHHALYGHVLERRRQAWLSTLENRFGPPVVEGDRFMVFTFRESSSSIP